MKNKSLPLALSAASVVLVGVGTASVVSAQATEAEEAPGATVEEQDRTGDAATDGERSGRRNGGERHRDGRGCGGSQTTVAEVIGIEVDELRSALDEGQTIAEVAEANGVDPDTVVDALIADAEARLDEKVESGRLSEDEAADKLTEKTERIEDRVAGVEPDTEVASDEEAS